MIYKDGTFSFIDLELEPATSKFNGICSIGESIWAIPYGIFDNFRTILQIKNGRPIYHSLDRPGKGQFYSLASNGNQAFSFPLGYEDTSFAIHIENDSINLIDFKTQGHKKMHMGTVFCNGKFWSAPRGDSQGYANVVSFDGNNIETYPIKFKQSHILRKYTDFIVKENKLFALPFGQNGHLDEVLVFDTDTLTYKFDQLDIPVFFKKFNCGVLIEDTIIALPYGDKSQTNSNYGLVYNCDTGSSKHFNFGDDLGFGGKYRFRCCLAFNDLAVFFPTGTPNVPLLALDKDGNVIFKKYFTEFVLGRPVTFQNKIWNIAYHIETKKHFLISIDGNFATEFIPIP
jgi:hypothetical protein